MFKNFPCIKICLKIFHELTHSVLHESTWHQTLCSLNKFFLGHTITHINIPIAIFIQHGPVVTPFISAPFSI